MLIHIKFIVCLLREKRKQIIYLRETTSLKERAIFNKEKGAGEYFLRWKHCLWDERCSVPN